MITSFANKGLEKFWTKGSKAGIQPAHASKLNLILNALNVANAPAEMDFSGWNFKPLKNWGVDFYSVQVNGNYRVTWFWKSGNAEKVDYLDYH